MRGLTLRSLSIPGCMIIVMVCAWILRPALIQAVPLPQAENLPRTIDDSEFWRLVSDFSEPGGTFPQQYMSNEDSAQFVIPALKQTARQGGAYIGVGLEQNFTYIA